MLKPLVQAMVKAGYCVSPNNIHSLPGVGMYPAGPCIPEPPGYLSVQVDDSIKLYREGSFDGERLINGKVVIRITHEFETVDEFIGWCKEYGKISEGGQPPNVWD